MSSVIIDFSTKLTLKDSFSIGSLSRDKRATHYLDFDNFAVPVLLTDSKDLIYLPMYLPIFHLGMPPFIGKMMHPLMLHTIVSLDPPRVDVGEVLKGVAKSSTIILDKGFEITGRYMLKDSTAGNLTYYDSRPMTRKDLEEYMEKLSVIKIDRKHVSGFPMWFAVFLSERKKVLTPKRLFSGIWSKREDDITVFLNIQGLTVPIKAKHLDYDKHTG